MWRMRNRDGGETGAVAVLVALALVALLGFVALAVDVGTLYTKKAQVQNGSDAAALAVAQKCAANTSDPNCSTTSPIAADVANKNANNGLNNIRSIALDLQNRKVTVSAGAQESGGSPNTVSLFFARIWGIPNAEVDASSTVNWGSAVAGQAAFPVAFSTCQVTGYIGGGVQLLQNHGSGANPGCNYGPSGAAVDGGFGWLTQDAGACGSSINLATSEGGSAPGNSAPANCTTTLQNWASQITAGKSVTVLLPVYDAVTGTGSSAVFHLVAFAAFNVTGWKFSGDSTLPNTFHNDSPYAPTGLTCTGNCRGILGSFIKFVSIASGYTLGPVDAFGATVVRLAQ